MEQLTTILTTIDSWVWGWVMLIMILGTGLYLQTGLLLMPIRKLFFGFRMLWRGRMPEEGSKGEITPFNSLMTSLAATIGTGNIAGVATAITLGGPGALFWMWVTALVGMATKYAEAVCAVQYREVDKDGEYVGGPMYYIKNGLSKNWLWLGFAFAIFGTIAGFGIGNTVQANSVAQIIHDTFGFEKLHIGLVIMVLVGVVLIGGIRWVAEVAGKLVPFMAIAYMIGGLAVLLVNIQEIPAAFALIIESAFTGHAAVGGFAGAAMLAAIRWGVARGVFSNEAGLGSAPMAHAAAKTKGPAHQGIIAMLGTFIDTIVVCTITGLAIVVTGVWTGGETGAVLTSKAFETSLPGFGHYIVTFGLAIFAFTTILGWSVYGERCAEFLFGERSKIVFRILWVVMIPVGTAVNLGIVWTVADILNACMAIPNLIAPVLLSPVVFRLTREFFNKRAEPLEQQPG